MQFFFLILPCCCSFVARERNFCLVLVARRVYRLLTTVNKQTETSSCSLMQTGGLQEELEPAMAGVFRLSHACRASSTCLRPPTEQSVWVCASPTGCRCCRCYCCYCRGVGGFLAVDACPMAFLGSLNGHKIAASAVKRPFHKSSNRSVARAATERKPRRRSRSADPAEVKHGHT